MTIDEAIEMYTSNAEYERTHGNLQGCLEFKQLVEWLRDYKQLREQTRWIPVSERLPKHYDSHDLIHRETARRIIDSPRTKEQMLMVLDSAENQKKTGHWVYDRTRDLDGECKYECSECGMGSDVDYPYCMRCGTRMVEPQERSDKE